MIPSIERRREPRVTLEQAVQVMPDDSQQTIWGRAANVSENGMFVTSSRLFGVGTELGVRLPLGEGDEAFMRLRGRVVRIASGSRPGMGIAFEDLGAHEADILRRALHGEPMTGWVREAKVWFAGTSQPTRVQARLGPDGLRLYCDLGFLRLGVPATLFFPDQQDRSYNGVLQAATLHVDPDDGVPRLELAMSVEEQPDPGQTWTYWPPPPVTIPDAPGESFDAAAPLVELAPVAGIEDARSGGGEELADDELSIETAFRPTEEIFALTGGRAPQPDVEPLRAVSGAIQARSLPEPCLPTGPSVQAPSLLANAEQRDEQRDEGDAYPSAEPLAGWDLLTLPAAEQSGWTMNADDVALPRQPRRRARVWLWLLALCMAGLTVASMTYTNLWQRVGDRLLVAHAQPQPGALLPTAAVIRVPVPPGVAPDAEDSSVEPAPASPRTTEPAEPAGKAAGTEPSPETSPASPSLEPDTATLIIPIEGSLAAARQYVLAKPDGVAVNLPHARPKVRFGDYQVQRGGFRVVWVRKRPQGGLHVRVLHEPSRVAAVKLTRSAVRITLQAVADPSTEAPAPSTDGDGAP